jgi:hypothetical protein
MNKKEAEQEALRKAKDTQSAAGKSSGMSGRDLVCYLLLLPIVVVQLCYHLQFQYNPEWFEDEDDGDGADDWDLSKYRREKEEEDLAEEELRIAQLGVVDDIHEGDAEGSGDGQRLHNGVES